MSPESQGITLREFARRAGCDPKVVRRKTQSGHLPTFSDGTVDPARLDVDWRSGVSPPRASGDTGDTIGDSETLGEAAERIVIDKGALWSKPEAERVKENYVAKLRQLEFDRERDC